MAHLSLPFAHPMPQGLAHQVGTLEKVEFLVKLQQLEGAAGTPAILLGQAVVDIPLVLRCPSHLTRGLPRDLPTGS